MDASKLDLDTEVEISWSTSVTITYRAKVALGDMVTADEFAKVQEHLSFPGSTLAGAVGQFGLADDLVAIETTETEYMYECTDRYLNWMDVTR